ncbi:MAG: aldo/keto reductase [Hyphomicrobiales bacterium]|nr:aldo/keto reductase [Hyphomicrobiales bacterium]
MSAASVPTIALSNGVAMPAIGLGTWPMTDDEATVAVDRALRIGWRLIDTAENYQNEVGVGRAIRASGVDRSEIFVTSKFNRKWHSVAGVREACEASLTRLGLDYLDLLLVHWPNPDQDRYVEAVEGLVAAQEAGLVRAIGVSNFKTTHLARLFERGLVPQVNQIQLDPWHRRDDIAALARTKGIVLESWGPLGRGGGLLADPVLAEIAAAHGRTPAQIVLRWHVENGWIALPKSSDPLRQAQNLAVFDFALSVEDRAALDGLDRPDPDMPDSDVFGH